MGNHKILILLINIVISIPFATALAQHVPVNPPSIRADFSGSWFNPQQSGHGLMVEVLDRQRAVIAWYSYDANGAPLWLHGVGAIRGDVIVAELSRFDGGRPPASWGEGDLHGTPWGTVTIEFPGCETAILRWASTEPGFESGELPLLRLTWLQGERCYAEEIYGLQIQHSFERGAQGFEAVFADLPENPQEVDYELDFRHELLPVPLSDYAGLRLTGNNHSDDLAMLVTAPIRGLLPNRLYRVEIEAEVASNVPHGCPGIGGSPGDSVYLKLGAVGYEPLAETDPGSGFLRLNFDYGNQSAGGQYARMVDTLANGRHCDDGLESEWEIKRISTQGQPLIVSTDERGDLWIFAGSDSGYEGFSQFYILGLITRLEPYASG